MFVQTQITVGTGSGLLVPDAAVQRDADKTVVYVVAGEGKFEKREVQLGANSDGYHEVLAGLKAGEKVVTEGSFLVKSQEKKGELGEEGHGH
jgi:cobalt-zinc-cadmium efflux system membrane fusion protein